MPEAAPASSGKLIYLGACLIAAVRLSRPQSAAEGEERRPLGQQPQNRRPHKRLRLPRLQDLGASEKGIPGDVCRMISLKCNRELPGTIPGQSAAPAGAAED